MNDKPENVQMAPEGIENAPLPPVTDRANWQAQLDELLVREKAHTREGDAIAAARRRLPMVEVDPTITVIGPQGPVPLLDVFEGRRQLVVYYHMWHDGKPAAGPMRRLHVLQRAGPRAVLPPLPRRHLRDVLRGPIRGERRYRDFMGWKCHGIRRRTPPKRCWPVAGSA